MKAKIERYARGEFGEDRPEVVVSREYIQLKIEAGTVCQQEIEVVSKNNCVIKGMVYDDQYILRFDSHTFIDKKFKLGFTFDASKRQQGKNFSGHIYIITDGGEFDIPYDIEIISPYIKTSTGSVDDMFQFATLAEHNWSEAIRVFESEEFIRTFLVNQPVYQKVYSTLSLSLSANQALEEFLVYIHKKRAVSLSLRYMEFRYDIPKMVEKHELVVTKNTWGFIHTEVRSDSKFIEIPRKYVEVEDFVGHNYNLEYFLNPEHLEGNTNIGHIIIENTYQKIVVTITVKRKLLEDFIPTRKMSDRYGIKINQVRLVKSYLDFCLGKFSLQDYVDKTRFALNNLIQYLPHGNIYKLGIMHMNILVGEIDVVEQEILRIDIDGADIIEGDMERCYYSYLKALLTKDIALIEQAITSINHQMKKSEDRLFYFWLLMYLDSGYAVDKALLYTKLKELYDQGENSPIIYYEICTIFNDQPLMFKHLDQVSIAAIRWGLRENYVSEDVISIFIKLAGKAHGFHPQIFLILKKIYQEHETTECLYVMCSMLIRGNKASEEYHSYFKSAVVGNLKIIGINESYIRSMDFSKYEIIPHSVLMYLNYKNTLNQKELSYLYANVVTNKEEYMSIYNEYIYNIEAFMETQILKGNMSDDLCVIYGEYLEPDVVKNQYASKLVNIIFKRKLTCNNDNIKLVIVTHKEIEKEVQVPLVNGVAYVDIINATAAISLVDVKGNRYVSTIPYRLEKLVDEEAYIDICNKYSPEDYRLLLYIYSKNIMDKVRSARSVNTCRTILDSKEFNEIAKQEALLGIIDYYYQNYDKEILEKYLLKLDIDHIEAKYGRDIIRYFIICGMYDKAYHVIEKFGFEELSDEHIERLIQVLSNVEELAGAELLTAMCIYLFKKGQYIEDELKWLTAFYKSGTSDMIKLWKRVAEYNLSNREFEENILGQFMFTDSSSKEIYDIFKVYYEGKKKGMVVKAFLKRTAYYYFIYEVKVPRFIFSCIYQEIQGGNIKDDITISALLYYFSRATDVEEYQEFIRNQVREFVNRGIVLPYFKIFKKVVPLPKDIFIKTYLVFKGEANRKITIDYSFGTTEREIKRSKMEGLREVLPGYYIKEFVLFHGEKLIYNIIEEVDGNVTIEESDSMISDSHSGIYNNRFELLNSMLLDQEMKDDKGMLFTMDKYLNNIRLFEENLKLL